MFARKYLEHCNKDTHRRGRDRTILYISIFLTSKLQSYNFHINETMLYFSYKQLLFWKL